MSELSYVCPFIEIASSLPGAQPTKFIIAPIGSSFGLKGPSVKVPKLSQKTVTKNHVSQTLLDICVLCICLQNFMNFSSECKAVLRAVMAFGAHLPGACMHSHLSIPAGHAAFKSACTASMNNIGPTPKSAGIS